MINEIEELQIMFCPFGSCDLKFCIETADAIGENIDWIFGEIENYRKSIGDVGYDNLDPCYVIYNSILEISRQEILEITKVDIVYHFKNPCDNIHSNFMCTAYDFSDASKKELKKLLRKHKIKTEHLSNATQYFLDQIFNV